MRGLWGLGRNGALPAIGLILLSSLLYVLGYSLSKRLVGTFGLSPFQVTFLRCGLVLGGTAAACAWSRGGLRWRRVLRPARAWEQRGAAAALVGSNALAVVAYGLMPVTAASALGFVAPLLVTALASVALGERVTLPRWLGVSAGFVGVLLVVGSPTGASVPGILASLAAAGAYALYQILLRRLRHVATAADTTVQVGLVGTVLLAGAMPILWHPVGPGALALVVLFTAIQTAALACLAAALRRGEGSRLAPWQFTGLVWAMLLDAVMFGAAPSVEGVLGGLLVIGGGIAAQLGPSRPAEGGR